MGVQPSTIMRRPISRPLVLAMCWPASSAACSHKACRHSRQRALASGFMVPLPLASAEPGVYIGALVLPAGGRWLVEVRLTQDGETRYRSTQEVTTQ